MWSCVKFEIIIYYQISVILVLIVYHFENTHLLLVQKHSYFIYKLWTITAVHCKYIVSDIIMCHVWTLLPMNQLNMTKRWSQCHNVCVIVSFLLCYYNFSFSYSIPCSQYSKQCNWCLPDRHESKSYLADINYLIYQLKKLKVVIPPKLDRVISQDFVDSRAMQSFSDIHHSCYLLMKKTSK